jgi:pyruvate kinase
MGLRAMAEAVHVFSSTLGSLPVPVLLAGQVLEHMTGHPTPTRSEICHLYDALERGYAGVVLSDETAVGRHPVESVRFARLFA